MTRQITDIAQIRSFITAGNALFTIVSKGTGARKTFLLEQAPLKPGYEKPGYLAKILAGPDNTRDYRYVGFVYHGRDGRLRIKPGRSNGDAAVALDWFLGFVSTGTMDRFEKIAEFWHAGRCGRCGRLLTTPESVASGLGPVCAEREALS